MKRVFDHVYSENRGSANRLLLIQWHIKLAEGAADAKRAECLNVHELL